MKFYLAIAAAFVLGFAAMSDNGKSAPAAKATATIQIKAPCVDFNAHYTCASAREAAGLRSVEAMMGSRNH